MPTAPRAWGDDDPPVPVPEPAQAPAPSRHLGLVAVIVVLAVAVVVAVIAFAGGGGGLPDRLGGQAQVTEGPAADAVEMIEDMEVEGVSFDVGLYGPPLNPAYMVMTFEGDVPSGTEGLLSSLPAGTFSNADAEIDFTKQITATLDGTEIVCAPATNTAVGMDMAMCLFAGGGTGGVVMGIASTDLQALMGTTQELVGELG
jgi:hypothetical protein